MADPDASSCTKLDAELINLEGISNVCEMEALLKSDELLEEECVSLYDVFLLTQEFYCEYRAYERNIRKILNDKLKNVNDNFEVIVYDMDYSTSLAHLVVVRNKKNLCEHEDIFFTKNERGIYIDELRGRKVLGEEVLTIIGEEMLELYDYQLTCKDKRLQNSCSIKTLNSEFYANISRSYVEIYLGNDVKRFYINLSPNTDKVKCKCSSSKLMQLLKRDYQKFYSNIFVKIEDCPQWMHCSLVKVRNEKLLKHKKKEKKRKRREEIKKIFKA